ncbi:hypothetical protein L6R52_41835 [Myxococcota bacterium]|nr:hypothetical protein [Myxococcota bacterium]
MAKGPWARIAGDLKSESYSTATQERLASRVSVEEQQTALEHEVMREMAEALGRADHRARQAIERVEAAGRALDAAADDVSRAKLLEAYEALRRAALDARLDLQIQREAIGIRRNDRLELIYPVPPKRR